MNPIKNIFWDVDGVLVDLTIGRTNRIIHTTHYRIPSLRACTLSLLAGLQNPAV